MFGPDGRERLATIPRFEDAVALETQKRDQDFPVRRQIVDDQNRRHFTTLNRQPAPHARARGARQPL